MDKSRAGGCACGNLRYTVSGPPNWTALCHCDDCRRACSAPIVAWMGYSLNRVDWDGVRATRASSAFATRGFCPECGTQMSFESSRWPGEVHLYPVTLDDPSDYVPDLHCYVSERLTWLHVVDDLPKHAGSADAP
ncbi:MAG: GFA family protein [Paracoccaceae bacterium]|nr:GFA family protein [Paracoccaceae bacterium]